MVEHECKYEHRWGEIMKTVETVEQAIIDIRNYADAMSKLINELTVQVAVNKQTITRLNWLNGIIMAALIAGNIKLWFF
jgi:flagellar biosynthesis/type III secretory pathway chaperone